MHLCFKKDPKTNLFSHFYPMIDMIYQIAFYAVSDSCVSPFSFYDHRLDLEFPQKTAQFIIESTSLE